MSYHNNPELEYAQLGWDLDLPPPCKEAGCPRMTVTSSESLDPRVASDGLKEIDREEIESLTADIDDPVLRQKVIASVRAEIARRREMMLRAGGI